MLRFPHHESAITPHGSGRPVLDPQSTCILTFADERAFCPPTRAPHNPLMRSSLLAPVPTACCTPDRGPTQATIGCYTSWSAQLIRPSLRAPSLSRVLRCNSLFSRPCCTCDPPRDSIHPFFLVRRSRKHRTPLALTTSQLAPSPIRSPPHETSRLGHNRRSRAHATPRLESRQTRHSREQEIVVPSATASSQLDLLT